MDDEIDLLRELCNVQFLREDSLDTELGERGVLILVSDRRDPLHAESLLGMDFLKLFADELRLPDRQLSRECRKGKKEGKKED